MKPETFYHIYNHANGYENLFWKEENYFYFLKRYANFITPIADTYAYCLMPNHFHFVLRIKSIEDVEITFGKFETFQKFEARISKQFSNLFSSYTQSLNKMYGRKGSLFIPNFKRREVDNSQYFMTLVHYIHANPVHHGFEKRIEDWQFSSFPSLISNNISLLKRKEVLEWFNGKDEFIKYHQQPIFPKLDLDFEL